MTESGVEFPRERESGNSVQSFVLDLSTESRAVAPGKPLETDFSSEAKLRRLTVRPLCKPSAKSPGCGPPSR